jgi:hypothetical protein
MTKPIPAGTVNFPVNMPRELRLQAGRHAFQKDKSLGEWVRELITAGLAATRSALCLRTEARLAAEEDRQAAKLLQRAKSTNGGFGPEDTEDILNALELISRSATRDQRISETLTA